MQLFKTKNLDPCNSVSLTDASGDSSKHIAKEINIGLDYSKSRVYAMKDISTDSTCAITGHTL